MKKLSIDLCAKAAESGDENLLGGYVWFGCRNVGCPATPCVTAATEQAARALWNQRSDSDE